MDGDGLCDHESTRITIFKIPKFNIKYTNDNENENVVDINKDEDKHKDEDEHKNKANQ